MKTYNAALQAQLDAYLSEQSGLPQSKAAAMIGVSPTALSQYRNSKYPGDVEAVESKIEEFLRTRSAAAQAEAEKAPYLSAGYLASTSTRWARTARCCPATPTLTTTTLTPSAMLSTVSGCAEVHDEEISKMAH